MKSNDKRESVEKTEEQLKQEQEQRMSVCSKELDALLNKHNCFLTVNMQKSEVLGNVVYIPNVVIGSR